ncbi:hypothetical protein ACI65C_004501 [Semiaphis heraclei]
MKRTKPVSVVFNKEGLTYAEMLKKIRQDTSIQSEEHNVDAVSKTANGQLRIVLNRKANNPDHFVKAISQAIGNGTTTKTFGDSSQIEILDIDEEATVEEILLAVTSSTGVPVSPKLLRVRKLAKRGIKSAVVVVPSSIVAKLCTKKLRIGYVSCRVRRWTEVKNCYKCQNFGHTRSSCEGPERSNQCWRCGIDGHRSKECANPPKCVLCRCAGSDEDHVMGSYRCNSYRRALEAEKRKLNKAASPKCPMCDAEINDAKHTLFECDAYENWRQQLYAEIGHRLTPQDLMGPDRGLHPPGHGAQMRG